MEQVGFSGRLSEALNALKMELMEIREQDVDLMKQLLTMENNLKTLKPKSSYMYKKRQEQKRRKTGIVTLMPEVKEEEVSCLSDRRGSCCSSEGSISSADDLSLSSDDSDSEDRQEVADCFSLSMPSATFYCKNKSKGSKFIGETNDEHVLISNIKVWKYKQSQLNQSVL